MSELLYLEPIGGIAGDMFLAAALDLGVDPRALENALEPLKLEGWHFSISRAERHGISGTHLDVVLEQPEDHPHRHWRDIRQMIESSALSPGVKSKALAAFTALARAEAHVHGVDIEAIQFHEVGAVDSIVDIVGAACVLELLGDPTVHAAPPPLGSGVMRSAHGMIPIPGPATLELLKDRPVRFEGTGELTTPTGAALLAALTRSGPPPAMIPRKVGFGVGTKDFPDRPNLLRATLASPADAKAALWVLEANLDDASPQLFARIFERLLEQGALDVWVTPALMKKGRPGQLLGVLCEGGRRAVLERIVFEESTTLGIRAHPVERQALSRRFDTVETAFGQIRMKIGELEGRVLNAAPEYEDALARAREKNAALKDVLAAAIAAWRARG